MQPQLSTALAVSRDMLVDALVADGCRAGDLHRAPLLSHQTCFHGDPLLRQDPRLRARRMPTFCTLPPRSVRVILVRIALIAPQLATDGRRRALQLGADLAGRKPTAAKMLNLVAFVLAQVRVAHVQFHLAVKLYRLARLRRSTAWGGALQN
jgi:hypothetical protein